MGAPTPSSTPPDTTVDLVGWFADHGRDLPWRHSRDPWAVLVAEAMLQQTQVSRVVDRWGRFLARFPDPPTCAAAPVADVIAEWAGLGYNRRALALHRTARVVVADHGGRLPRDLDALLALPGIGAYTARAVRVFAFEEDDAVLDTNVARILARTEGRRLTRAEAQALADGLVPPGQGWAWNQALLDVGAARCRPRDADCPACPLAPRCRWWADGRPEPDPARGSAGVSGGQSRFDGSDRQGRGRLVEALRSGPVASGDVARVMGWPDDVERARRVLAGLVAEGLVEGIEGGLRLPDDRRPLTVGPGPAPAP